MRREVQRDTREWCSKPLGDDYSSRILKIRACTHLFRALCRALAQYGASRVTSKSHHGSVSRQVAKPAKERDLDHPTPAVA